VQSGRSTQELKSLRCRQSPKQKQLQRNRQSSDIGYKHCNSSDGTADVGNTVSCKTTADTSTRRSQRQRSACSVLCCATETVVTVAAFRLCRDQQLLLLGMGEVVFNFTIIDNTGESIPINNVNNWTSNFLRRILMSRFEYIDRRNMSGHVLGRPLSPSQLPLYVWRLLDGGPDRRSGPPSNTVPWPT